MSVITCRSNVLRGVRPLPRNLPNEAQYNYVGGNSGSWQVTQLQALRGSPLSSVRHLEVIKGQLDRPLTGASWVLSGLVRNTRYVSREEPNLSDSGRRQVPKSDAPCAALIAIRRSEQWWQLGQAARREIMEVRSLYLTAGLHYLSGMMRRWQHRRDLSEQFDCVTWFEYEPRDSAAFDDILFDWRASEEWNYVDRECDIRLIQSGG